MTANLVDSRFNAIMDSYEEISRAGDNDQNSQNDLQDMEKLSMGVKSEVGSVVHKSRQRNQKMEVLQGLGSTQID